MIPAEAHGDEAISRNGTQVKRPALTPCDSQDTLVALEPDPGPLPQDPGDWHSVSEIGGFTLALLAFKVGTT